MSVDWRAVRDVLKTVKPGWQPSTGDEPNPDYEFANAIIQTFYDRLRVTCLGCKVSRQPHEFYRCWDCKSYLCEECIKGHMGSNHVPHTRRAE